MKFEDAVQIVNAIDAMFVFQTKTYEEAKSRLVEVLMIVFKDIEVKSKDYGAPY